MSNKENIARVKKQTYCSVNDTFLFQQFSE